MKEDAIPLFSSAQPALRFCYGYAAEQYEQSIMAKMARRQSAGEGRGLSGLDGAANAGFIRDIVSQDLSNLHLAIMVARCAPMVHACRCGALCCSKKKRNAEWEAAIAYLVQASVSEFSGRVVVRGLLEALIRQHFGQKKEDERTVRDLAKKYSVNRETVADYRTTIKRWLWGDNPAKVKQNPRKGEEMRAWAEAEAILTETGIVGPF